MDAVQRANSGHPGMPMGMADVATVLWTRYLKYDASAPDWPDRDRFILSAGHGSMLLYSLLYLSGTSLTLDDLKNFRQLHSPTAGHPEYGEAPMIETTTGPLGQGFANGVGMAIAQKFLQARFGTDLCDHRIYTLAGDGCLMEGVCYEAASLAGHLRLGNLICLYDDNEITIDGPTQLSWGEDRVMRFEAMGWHVQVIDGHDTDQIAEAIEAAQGEVRPSLICCRTIIGCGAPNLQGSAKTHGAPLGAEEIRLAKSGLGMNPDVDFAVPEEALSAFRARDGVRRAEREAWEARLEASDKRDELGQWLASDMSDWLAQVNWPKFDAGSKVATRAASGKAIAAIAEAVPSFVGGSADLAGSNKTLIPDGGDIVADDFGLRNLHFGIREHAMASVCNGMALHGGVAPYCATFLVFHDYMRPAVRLSALMKQPVIYVYTHDSVFVGEDGPTHQPIEHLMAMRSIPGLTVLRPCDAVETVEAWKLALKRRDGPTALVLTRQGLPTVDRDNGPHASLVERGGYVLSDADNPQVILIASGSEVSVAVEAQEQLSAEGIAARVVNLASWSLFDAQDAAWKASVLPAGVPRVSVEAGRTQGWEKYVGLEGAMVGLDRFGMSAPGAQVAAHLGLTADRVASAAKSVLA